MFRRDLFVRNDRVIIDGPEKPDTNPSAMYASLQHIVARTNMEQQQIFFLFILDGAAFDGSGESWLLILCADL